MSPTGHKLARAAEALDDITRAGLDEFIAEVDKPFDPAKLEEAINGIRFLGLEAARFALSEMDVHEALLRARSTSSAIVEMFKRVDAARARVIALGGALTVLDGGDGKLTFGAAFMGKAGSWSKEFGHLPALEREIADLERLAEPARPRG